MVIMYNGTPFAQASIKRIQHPIGFEPRLGNVRNDHVDMREIRQLLGEKYKRDRTRANDLWIITTRPYRIELQSCWLSYT